MAVSADVIEIVRILDEEGFGVLAGEVLSEINLGREVVQDEIGEDEDAALSRSPTSEEEQLQEVMHILRLRLVEPARKLADAEMIAGRLTHREAVRIRFVDPEDRPGDGGARLPPGDAPPGDRLAANDLDALLDRIMSMRGAEHS
jgi:hypothetical protein